MEMVQRVVVPLGSETIWGGLVDPSVLRESLFGCESCVLTDAGHYDFVLLAKLGPLKTRFEGTIMLSDVVEGVSVTLAGSGKGGVAGHAKGTARVRLESLGEDETVLHYSVQASVGGKLAQLGSRLVDGAARKIANDFLTRFVRVLCGDDSVEIRPETVDA